MKSLTEFHGPNAGYVLELYDRYLEDPASVDTATRAFFETWTPPADIEVAAPAISTQTPPGFDPGKVAAAVNLSQAIRTYGHLSAQLDPLGSPPPGDPWHALAYHGITDADLKSLPGSIIGGPLAEDADTAFAAIQMLRQVYSARIGYDYEHIQIPEEREWLREAAECGEYRPPVDPFDPLALLERLSQVEAFEQFLQVMFPGKTRFSIEGLDILVPILDNLMQAAARSEICTVLIGMAHRGRLNILAHILGKPYSQILAEFKDPISHFPTREELGWSGDVKYHKGAQYALAGGESGEAILLVVEMPPNPSHLEHIDPVLVGMARAAGSKVDKPGPPEFFPSASLPVMIHGDASFTGQGVVAETLNLSRLEGYSVGGTIHIIANNQLGYTTTPQEGRSTLYASDLAKGYEIPIIHVNADDPQGCLEAIRTAFAYRQHFHKDFLIDLIGYRRYGHNEGDEPSFTQPQMYALIDSHPSVRKIWADLLIEQGLVDETQAEAYLQKYMDELQNVLAHLEPEEELEQPLIEPPPHGAAKHVDTAVPLAELKTLNEALLDIPGDFALHRKMKRALDRRKKVFDDPDSPRIDWATAEELAFASILADGISIRITGEDVERGTFSQRHAVFHSVDSPKVHVPLQTIPQAKAAFEIVNSPLSENAAIGFEFGYNVTMPRRLVVWEAQYGDFFNTAQTMIDEFLLSARAKWEQTPSLVLLLPHGDEGQGPDHSSGRPERFLELAADFNLRLANCTTAAQFFHLLRRQVALLETDPLPLIVLTPKSLLRHPLVASPPRQLAEGRWMPVIDDDQARPHPEEIERLIFCSGKIYMDLVSDERRQDNKKIAIARLEQLYPVPQDVLEPLINAYPNLQEVLWVQEEPENMGAWTFIAPHLEALIRGRCPLRYAGRPRSASPAEGSGAMQKENLEALISQAYQIENIPLKEGK